MHLVLILNRTTKKKRHELEMPKQKLLLRHPQSLILEQRHVMLSTLQVVVWHQWLLLALLIWTLNQHPRMNREAGESECEEAGCYRSTT